DRRRRGGGVEGRAVGGACAGGVRSDAARRPGDRGHARGVCRHAHPGREALARRPRHRRRGARGRGGAGGRPRDDELPGRRDGAGAARARGPAQHAPDRVRGPERDRPRPDGPALPPARPRAADRAARTDASAHPAAGKPALMAAVETTDVVVIGTGFGGAIPAYYLSAAGARVVMLERGPRFASEDFTQDLRLDTYTRIVDLINGTGMSVVAGNCVGGGSVVYFAASLR